MNTRFKAYFALALLFTLPVGLRPADSADIASEQTIEAEETKTLLFLLSDGSTAQVPKKHAMHSMTIKNLLDCFSTEACAAGIPATDPHCTRVLLVELFGDGGYVEKFVAGNLTMDDLPNELNSLIPTLLAINFLDIVVNKGNDQERALIDILSQKITTCLNPDMLENAELAWELEATGKLPLELQALIAKRLLASDLGQRAIGSLTQTIEHKKSVRFIAFSPSGRYFASGSDDNTARVYNLENLEKPIQIARHTRGVTGIAFSPSGRYFTTGSIDKTVCVYDLENLEASILAVEHSHAISRIASSPCGKYFATLSDDETARVYNLESLEGPILIAQHTRNITGIAFSLCGRYFATGSYDNTAQVYDLETPEKPIKIIQHAEVISSIAFSPCGRYFATGSYDNTARVYNLENLEEQILTAKHTRGVTGTAFSLCGRYFTTGSIDKTVCVYDLENGEAPILAVKHSHAISRIASSPCGKYLAAGYYGNTARVYNLENLEEPILMALHTDRISSITFSSCGRYFATVSNDRTTRVYNLEHPEEEPILTAQHTHAIYSIAFSPCGRYFATGSNDKTAQLHAMPQRHFWYKYLTIKQALFILLSQQKTDGVLTILPSDLMLKIWSSFPPEQRRFLSAKFGPSCLGEIMQERKQAATKIQAVARGYLSRKQH